MLDEIFVIYLQKVILFVVYLFVVISLVIGVIILCYCCCGPYVLLEYAMKVSSGDFKLRVSQVHWRKIPK
jgi:hypothetical protein